MSGLTKIQLNALILLGIILAILFFKRLKKRQTNKPLTQQDLAELQAYNTTALAIAPKQMNNINAFEVLPNAAFDIAANTAHEIHYAVLEGTATIQIGAKSIANLPLGSDVLKAEGLIAQAVRFTTTGRIVGHYIS